MSRNTWKTALPALLLVQVFFIYAYYMARLRDDLSSVALYQPATTVVTLVIILLAVFLSPYVNKKMALFIGVGMFLCFIADILNLDMGDPFVVLRGLIIFFVGYTIYAATVFARTASWKSLIPVALTVLIFSVAISLIWDNVPSELRIPFITYGLLIASLVSSGFSYWRWGPVGSLGGLLLFIGFLSLYTGDMEFAISTFYKPTGITIGPILYSGGQTFVALSVFFHDSNIQDFRNNLVREV